MNWYKIAQENELKIITIDRVMTGQPCIVQAYHGTPDGRFLPEFDPQKAGYYPDAPEFLADDNKAFIDTYGGIRQGFKEKSSTGNIGVSFTDSYQTAKSYSEKPAFDYRNSIPMVVQRYIKLENPKVIDLNGQKWTLSVRNDISTAISEGYDALILKNVKDHYHPDTTPSSTNNLIAFNTNNIMTSLDTAKNNEEEYNTNETEQNQTNVDIESKNELV